MPSSHTSSITIPLIIGTPIIGTLRGDPTVPTTPQRSYNRLEILKHHRNNNEHSENNNNNYYYYYNYNNNTVSTTHTQEKCISSLHSNRSGILCHNSVSNSPEFYFSAIYLSKSYLNVPRTPLGVALY